MVRFEQGTVGVYEEREERQGEGWKTLGDEVFYCEYGDGTGLWNEVTIVPLHKINAFK